MLIPDNERRNCRECNCEFKPTGEYRRICSNKCKLNRAENKKLIPFKSKRTKKPCTKCGKILKLKKYGLRKTTSGNFIHRSKCNSCLNEYNKIRYHKNPKDMRIRMRKYRYGLTEDMYLNMIKKTDGRCYICNKVMKEIEVDHCHKTGVVRGLLCRKCNVGIAFFDDNVNLFKRAIEYLQKKH